MLSVQQRPGAAEIGSVLARGCRDLSQAALIALAAVVTSNVFAILSFFYLKL